MIPTLRFIQTTITKARQRLAFVISLKFVLNTIFFDSMEQNRTPLYLKVNYVYLPVQIVQTC